MPVATRRPPDMADTAAHTLRRKPKRKRGAPRGAGDAAKRHCEILFANVTSWSAKARDYMVNSMAADVFLAVETHGAIGQEAKLVAGVKAQGWIPSITPSRPSTSSEGGTYGGAIAGRRRHISGGPLADDVQQWGGWKSPHANLVGTQLALKGASVMVLGSYHKGGIDSAVLETVKVLTHGGNFPFILLGDFNVDPQILEGSGWPTAMQAQIVSTPLGVFTCTSVAEGGGSRIDFAVVSNVLRPLVAAFRISWNVPFAPHAACTLVLKRAAFTYRIQVLRRPSGFLVGCAEQGAPLDWKTAYAAAVEHVARAPDVAKQCPLSAALARKVGTLEDSEEVGARLWTWARASELCTLASAGLDWSSSRNSRFLGRGAPPSFRWVAVARPQKQPRPDVLTPAGLSLSLRALHTIRSVAFRVDSRRAANHWAGVMASFLRKGDDCMEQLWADLTASEAARLTRAMLGAVSFAGGDEGARLHYTAQIADALIKRLGQRQRSGWRRDWEARVFQMLDGSAGEAHAFCKHNLDGQGSELVLGCRQQGAQERVDDLRRKWCTKWEGDNEEQWAAVATAVRSWRRSLLGENSSRESVQNLFTPASIRAACRTFKRRTALGADAMCFQWIQQQDDESLAVLSDILADVVLTLAIPLQEQTNLLFALTKKLGGHRMIGVGSSINRLLLSMLCSRSVRSWDKQRAPELDSAAPGRDCQWAAFTRSAALESAALRGKFAALVLWDLDAFYDSIDIETQIQKCRAHGFPPSVAVLALQNHLAPRVIVAEQAHSAPVTPSRSLIAGCSSSTSFARALTLELGDTTGAEPWTQTHQHVDDIGQLIVASSRGELISRTIQTSTALLQNIRGLRLNLSAKSAIVATEHGTAVEIAKCLARRGICVAPKRQADDLGVGTAGGAQRASKTTRARIERGLARTRRARLLGFVSSKAKKLYSTGCKPVQTYGSRAHGLSPSQVNKRRRAAAWIGGYSGHQPCLTSAIAWHFPRKVDLAVEQASNQLKDWCKLWAMSSSSQRNEFTQAWREARDRLASTDASKRWKRACGPISATICTLMDHQWLPLSPTIWIDVQGNQKAHIGQSGWRDTAILAFFEKQAAQRLWAKAADGHSGGGLEKGTPALGPARNAWRKLLRRGLKERAAALSAIVCGGVVHAGRFGTTFVARCCPRCGKEEETLVHRYYLCPSNDGIKDDDDEILHKTKFTIDLARAATSDQLALWCRAIVPSDWWDYTDELEAVDKEIGNLGRSITASSCVFTDGAGGARLIPAEIRQVGAGGFAMDIDVTGWDTTDNEDPTVNCRSAGLACWRVPGRQTVPRAELAAGLGALKALAAEEGAAQPRKPVEIRSDAAYFVRGANQDEGLFRVKCSGTNGDLWQGFHDLGGRDQCTVSKVKAHTSIFDVASGATRLEDYIGNGFADLAAGLAAEISQPSDNLCRTASRWLGIGYLVALRISHIEAAIRSQAPCMVPEPTFDPIPTPATVKEAEEVANAAAKRSGHLWAKQRSGFRCARCRDWKSARHLRTCSTFCPEALPPPIQSVSASTDNGTDDGVNQAARGGIHDFDNAEAFHDELEHDEPLPPGYEPAQEEPLEEPIWLPAAPSEDQNEEAVPLVTNKQATRARAAHRRELLRVLAQDRRSTAIGLKNWVDTRPSIGAAQNTIATSVVEPTSTPQWAKQAVHSSHEAFHVGGAIFCAKCGATAAAATRRSLLLVACRGITPAGSVSRLRRLQSGKLTTNFGDNWLDGIGDANQIRAVRRLSWDNDQAAWGM